jgi:hypothetical protein
MLLAYDPSSLGSLNEEENAHQEKDLNFVHN